ASPCNPGGGKRMAWAIPPYTDPAAPVVALSPASPTNVRRYCMVKVTNDFGELDAAALAEHERRREVSALELVENYIRLSESANGTLNAVIADMFEAARAQARGPLPNGPFSGVPFLMKDFAAEIAGVPFREGSAFLDGYIPQEDTEIYRRF